METRLTGLWLHRAINDGRGAHLAPFSPVLFSLLPEVGEEMTAM